MFSLYLVKMLNPLKLCYLAVWSMVQTVLLKERGPINLKTKLVEHKDAWNNQKEKTSALPTAVSNGHHKYCINDSLLNTLTGQHILLLQNFLSHPQASVSSVWIS